VRGVQEERRGWRGKERQRERQAEVCPLDVSCPWFEDGDQMVMKRMMMIREGG